MKKDKWNIQFRNRHCRNNCFFFQTDTTGFCWEAKLVLYFEKSRAITSLQSTKNGFPTCLQDFNLASYWNFQGDQSRTEKRQQAFSWEILQVEQNLLLPEYLKTLYEMSFHTLKSTLKPQTQHSLSFLMHHFHRAFLSVRGKIKSICSVIGEVWKHTDICVC